MYVPLTSCIKRERRSANRRCLGFVKYAWLGRHVQVLSLHQITIFLKLQIVVSFLNAFAVTLPKLCILCLYLRVFQAKPYRFATYFIAAFLIAHMTAHFLLQFGMCTPFEKQWHPWIKGRCLNSYKVFVWSSFPSIIGDVMIIILPLPLIWTLQTTIGQKLGLTATFLTGSMYVSISPPPSQPQISLACLILPTNSVKTEES